MKLRRAVVQVLPVELQAWDKSLFGSPIKLQETGVIKCPF